MHQRWALLLVLLSGLAQAAEPDRLVTVKPGTIPIILSAPHGGRQPIPDAPERKGVGIEQFATARDENTAELAERIAAEVEKRLKGKPYVVIARFERKYADANRSEEAGVESDAARPCYKAYHAALADFTKVVQKNFKHGLLLDIHGQAQHPGALVRGTNNGQTVELLLKRFGKPALTGPKSLFGAFAGMGYSIIPATDSDDKEDKRFLGGHIVRTYGSHQGNAIDAIQLEFGSDLRQKSKLNQTASAIAEAIEIFSRVYLPEAVGKR